MSIQWVQRLLVIFLYDIAFKFAFGRLISKANRGRGDGRGALRGARNFARPAGRRRYLSRSMLIILGVVRVFSGARGGRPVSSSGAQEKPGMTSNRARDIQRGRTGQPRAAPYPEQSPEPRRDPVFDSAKVRPYPYCTLYLRVPGY